jgi:acyl-CoA thioesterase I
VGRRPPVAVLSLLAGLAVLLAGVVSGCSSARSAQRPSVTTAAVPSGLTALGDSVPAGSACDCTPYPEQVAADRHLDAANDAVPGYESQDVIGQLDDDHHVIDDVSRSRVVLIEVGANDVSETDACGTTRSCYQPKVPTIGTNLTRIVDRVRQLAPGPGVEVVLVDYWSAWLAGQYATARGAAYVATAQGLTEQVNAEILAVAEHTHSVDVDLVGPFGGPDVSKDDTGLLAPDGDHPNAAGQAVIAAAVEEALAGH